MEGSAGKALREAREVRGYTIDEVASRLKLPPRYVHALENDDFAALPEPTFVRGYVRAYARLLRLDEEALLASCARVEIRAPKPLVGPEGTVTPPAKMASAPRGPSFRHGQSRIRPHHWAAGALVAAVAVFWVAGGQHEAPVAPAPVVVPAPATPAASLPAPAPVVPGGAVMVDVPLPGSPASPASVATAAAPASAAVGPATTPAATSAATTVHGSALPVPAQPASGQGAPANVATQPPTRPVEAPVPRKGLFLRFSGTSWLEVRDADNVVLHTRIEMAGSDVALEGKAPFTVTLGEAGSAQVWYNGDRVKADRIASTGVARLIVGRPAR